MMDRGVEEFDQTGDFRTMRGEGLTAVRTKFEEPLRDAKTQPAEASQPVFDRTREADALADDYAAIHGLPPVSRSQPGC